MSYKDDIFLPARNSLRIKQDERETVIRSCREITSYSKKCIFSIHRDLEKVQLKKELIEYLIVIREHLITINEIYFNDNFQLRGTISGAIEELIEFFTFCCYKYHSELIQYERFIELINLITNDLKEIENVVTYILNEESDIILLWAPTLTSPMIDKADYLMGLFDCTGEIMRMVISNSTDTHGKFKNLETLNDYNFMKKLYENYILLQSYYPGISIYNGIFDDSINSKGNNSFKKKLQVFESSINKIENTLIDLLISDKEIL
ncbi:hypothetical protein KGF54_001577 [Candida jiufengensis]|uniref:uncharacterized protein n=1 Tax=Candida jiufengensis TaxID=497108 RepID=UPI0022250FC7|nr:uncharacterized protein KGF54_001577 [Candida jiufengensis]KAI5955016.1 hypothetical protein KGF54_001577 [Candida jiufengensis]